MNHGTKKCGANSSGLLGKRPLNNGGGGGTDEARLQCVGYQWSVFMGGDSNVALRKVYVVQHLKKDSIL